MKKIVGGFLFSIGVLIVLFLVLCLISAIVDPGLPLKIQDFDPGVSVVLILFALVLFRIARQLLQRRRVYIVCSVRNRTGKEEESVLDYVESLERKGYKVKCPFRDTDQNDEIGLRIVEEHERDILWADEIHIIWNPASIGSHWDFGQARMAKRFRPSKKIVLVNSEEVEISRDKKGKIKKTFNNVLLAMHFGLGPNSNGCDLEKAKADNK